MGRDHKGVTEIGVEATGIYAWIRGYVAANNAAPRISDVALGVHYCHRTTKKYINQLVAEGVLRVKSSFCLLAGVEIILPPLMDE